MIPGLLAAGVGRSVMGSIIGPLIAVAVILALSVFAWLLKNAGDAGYLRSDNVHLIETLQNSNAAREREALEYENVSDVEKKLRQEIDALKEANRRRMAEELTTAESVPEENVCAVGCVIK